MLGTLFPLAFSARFLFRLAQIPCPYLYHYVSEYEMGRHSGANATGESLIMDHQPTAQMGQA